MRKILISLLVITLLTSGVLLLLDSKSKRGLLNDLAEEKGESLTGEAVDLREEENTASEAEKLVSDQEKFEEVVETEPFTIVIDPGHQKQANLEEEPVGPGATEMKPKVLAGTAGVVTNIPEYVLTLEASFLLQTHLEEKGYEVILTRTEHEVDISNRERAEVANENEADLFLRIHADGSESSDVAGFSLLVPGQDNEYTQGIYEDSLRAAEAIIKKVEGEILLLSDGIFLRNDLSGFNWSEVPVILVELGFMTNPVEDQQLADESYLTELTRKIAHGVQEYLENES